MTAKEDAAKVAKAVTDGSADKMTKFLFGLLPKSAHGKIPAILAEFETQLDERTAADLSIGQIVGVDPLNKRAVHDTVRAYGLELDLDAAGLATRVTTPYEFVA